LQIYLTNSKYKQRNLAKQEAKADSARKVALETAELSIEEQQEQDAKEGYDNTAKAKDSVKKSPKPT